MPRNGRRLCVVEREVRWANMNLRSVNDGHRHSGCVCSCSLTIIDIAMPTNGSWLFCVVRDIWFAMCDVRFLSVKCEWGHRQSGFAVYSSLTIVDFTVPTKDSRFSAFWETFDVRCTIFSVKCEWGHRDGGFAGSCSLTVVDITMPTKSRRVVLCGATFEVRLQSVNKVPIAGSCSLMIATM